MKNKILLTLALTLILGGRGYSQTNEDSRIKKETFIYSIKGQDTLRLDKYDLPSLDKDRPCVIFLFGGGFIQGNRDSKGYLPFFHQLANNGYSVVSIDYRLGLKKASEERKRTKNANGNKAKMDLLQSLGILTNSINMAVEDLYDATNFIVNHAQDWKIDKSAIITSGSSAGAITVLHGEYELCNNRVLSRKLTKDFKYAGVIAFAGAIFDGDGDLQWATTPAPIQLFHGDADKNVPFNSITVEFAKAGLYGSKYIADKLDAVNSPYYFYQVENAGHELAFNPMRENWNEIKSFLDKLVLGKQNRIINTCVKEPGKPEVKKDFTILDFIRFNNFDLNK